MNIEIIALAAALAVGFACGRIKNRSRLDSVSVLIDKVEKAATKGGRKGAVWLPELESGWSLFGFMI